MKIKKDIMNSSEGEVFHMRIGDEDSDEDNEDTEVAFLDSGCSKTSLRNRKHFTRVAKTEGKSVNTANGKIHVKYIGESGPFEEAHWIPELKNNLISIGDLISRGMTIIIKPSGMMYGNFDGKEIFSIMMKNNVWTMNTNKLFKKLDSLPKQHTKRKKLNINYANMLIITSKDKETKDKLNLLHKRLFHRGKNVIIRDYNKNLFEIDLFKNIDKLKVDHIDNQKCGSCMNAKSSLLPRPSKTVQVTHTNREVNSDYVFECGIVSTDLTGPYAIKSYNEKFNGSQTFTIMDSKKTFTFGYKKKSDSLNNLKRLVEEELKIGRAHV
jgi:hypothetical protein